MAELADAADSKFASFGSGGSTPPPGNTSRPLMESRLNLSPSPETFRKHARGGNVIPIYAELTADCETPVSVYARLRTRRPSFLFESIERGEAVGRYSLVGCSPRKIFKTFESTTEIKTKGIPGIQTVPTPPDPLTLVESEMAAYQPVEPPQGTPPFTGGAVGFLAYEYIHCIEPSVPVTADNTLGTPLLYYMITDSVVVFDHARQTLRIYANAHLNSKQTPEVAYTAAADEIDSIADLLRGPQDLAPISLSSSPEIEIPDSTFTPEKFENLVKNVQNYIRAGDVIQVVGSQRFSKPFPHSPLDLYRALRIINPSPYMFLMDTGDYTLVGASPEVHVRLTQDKVEIRPIAGTRPRSPDTTKDHDLARELLADAKENAEHLMLVDLARNDIGRVCQPGSVHVPEYKIIERYSHVMHLVSQVEGRLAKKHNAYDLMRATFPAGTVSGAPKIRAMQIIAELEQTQRGPYAGALGYFGYEGTLDSCIAIRTSVLKDGMLYLNAGAGIVADSNPAAEYQETLNKASAILKSVGLAQAATRT